MPSSSGLGGVKMQLYWHFKPSTNPPLETIPDNRVYVSQDQADDFVRCFVGFADGQVVADDKHADAGEIGRAGETYRRISITSLFGNMQVLVTDGHLPYPFGHELTGYQVQDLGVTLEKAKGAGVKILSGPYKTRDRTHRNRGISWRLHRRNTQSDRPRIAPSGREVRVPKSVKSSAFLTKI